MEFNPTGDGGVPGLYVPQNDGYVILYVHAPILRKQAIGAFHEYPITGVDSNGEISCARRFNLFFEFREALVLKYPGLYIPPLPPKKVTGKSEEFTLIERQHFLDLFLKECTALKYISQSLELQTFLKETGDLEKALSKLQTKNSTANRIAIYRACLPIDEVRIGT